MTSLEVGAAAAVVLVVAVLLYRLFRREPATRIVRLGVFIERQGNGSEQPTTRFEWPAPKE